MFTRCPHCHTLFRVTAGVLAQAGGDVRCGRCGASFNALPHLSDDAPGGMKAGTDAAAPPPPPAPAPAVEAPPVAAPAALLDANQGPTASGPPEPVAAELPEDTPEEIAPDTGTATMPALAPAAVEQATVPEVGLDFDIPEEDWSRFFDDAHGIGAEGDGDERPPVEPEFQVQSVTTGITPEPGDEAPSTRLDEEVSDTDTWQAFLREVPGEDEDAGPVYVIRGNEDPAPAELTPAEPPAIPRHDLAEAAPALEEDIHAESVPDAGDEPPEILLPDEELADLEPASDEPEYQDGPALEDEVLLGNPEVAPAADAILHWKGTPAAGAPPPRHTGWWLAASLVLVVTLAAQAVFANRDALAADPRFGQTLRSVAERLQLPLYPTWPLGAYELRGAEAIAGRTASGALDIVGDVAVVGTQPVGLPMIRVVLRDRWSNVIGARLLAPAEYQPDGSGRLAQPGTLIPVQISLADPGPSAQGYELDLCVPDRFRGLQCQQSRDPFQR
jgi:predicted Zn finger-like uncharacterized protein